MTIFSACFLIGAVLMVHMPHVTHAQDNHIDLRLPSFFSDRMVLQRDKPIRVWGQASPGAEVRVRLGSAEKTVTASADGTWFMELPPRTSGGQPLEMDVSSGRDALKIRDILLGDVWLCSGQSNMALPLSKSNGGAAEAQASADPKLRFFTTEFHAPNEPVDDVSGEWVESSTETARSFSAVAYYFGKQLRNELNVPVGLILSAHGATAIESWMSREALQSDPDFKPILDKLAATVIDPNGWDMHLPSGLFHGRILPLAPLPLCGVIWYQGETNAKRAWQYRKLFPALIQDWRKAWDEELPFYFVQLANYQKPPTHPVNEEWAELREAQALALKLPHTGMAVAIDVGEEKNIHPSNKKTVGERLAALALARNYGKMTTDSGPLYRSMEVEDGKIRIGFDSTGSGLEARGGKLKQFAIAGADNKFVWADAVIEGDSVLVSSPQVPEPVAVRYAWANNPAGCNLYNKDGFPAAPFRTDDWPGVTEKNHLVAVPPALPKPPMDPILDPSIGLTGNTLEVDLGKDIERNWDQVKANGYRYGARQKREGKEIHIWLPYEEEPGLYYELEGFQLEATRHDNPAELVYSGGGKQGKLTLKFRFSAPIAGFRLKTGPVNFQAHGAVAGFEYSADGKNWKPFHEISGGGQINRWIDPKGPKAEGLNTRDLYLRCYVRGPGGSAGVPDNTRLRARMAGDVRWGDASRTFSQAQWQMWVELAL